MKYLLFVLLLVAVLITAGCVRENKNTVSTSTLTTPQASINTVSTTALPTIVTRAYCNDTRSLLEISGALPGSRFSSFHWTDKASQSDKDNMLNLYKDYFFSFKNFTASGNELNILLLENSPIASKYQSCKWMVHCLNDGSGEKCVDIPLKYRVTYTVDGTLKYQDFPISQPINFDFDDNDLLKMIKIQASNNTVSTTALPTQSPTIKPTSFITTYPSPVHTYDPCIDQYDPTCGPEQVRYYGTCMYGVKIVCRPVYQ